MFPFVCNGAKGDHLKQLADVARLTMMERIEAAMGSGDVNALSSVLAQAQALRGEAEALQREEAKLRRFRSNFRLKAAMMPSGSCTLPSKIASSTIMRPL